MNRSPTLDAHPLQCMGVRTCFIIALLALASAAFARDDDVLLREDVERRMVAVRIVDAAMADVIAYGSGMIVGEHEGEFFIATAKHVIAPPDMKADEFFIEVRFFRRDEWIRLSKPPLASSQRDLAVLIAPVKWSPYEPQTLESILPVAAVDSQTQLKAITLFGVDVENKREIRQSSGTIATVDGDKIIFDSPDVKPGWSGGIVLNEIGLVGMIVSEGSGRQGHQAIAWTAMLDELKSMNVSLAVRSEPLLAALDSVRKNGLAIAMFVWDGSSGTRLIGEWGAMRMTSQNGLVFSGDCISVRAGGGTCALEPRGSEIIATIPSRLLWRSNERDPPPTFTFSPTSDGTARGMIVLKCVYGESTAYMAIPAGNSELLGAAIIRQAAGNEWQRLGLDQSMMQGFNVQGQENDFLLEGKRPAFPMSFPRPGTVWTIALDKSPNAMLRTQIRVGEGAMRMSDRERAKYDTQRAVLRAADGGAEVSRKKVRSDGTRTSNWVVEVPQRFTLSFEGDQRSTEVPIVIEAAVVEYGANADMPKR